MIRTHLLVGVNMLFGVVFLGFAYGEEKTIRPENWKSCSTGKMSIENISWKEIPAWARAKHLQPYYHFNPRALALHGLCNAKFKRVVYCYPGWQDDENKDADWYRVCRAVLGDE